VTQRATRAFEPFARALDIVQENHRAAATRLIFSFRICVMPGVCRRQVIKEASSSARIIIP
jgi:hypothetical protein